MAYTKRELWIVEVRDVDTNLEKWGPTTQTYFSRDEARKNTEYWRSQGFSVRIRLYVPKEPT